MHKTVVELEVVDKSSVELVAGCTELVAAASGMNRIAVEAVDMSKIVEVVDTNKTVVAAADNFVENIRNMMAVDSFVENIRNNFHSSVESKTVHKKIHIRYHMTKNRIPNTKVDCKTIRKTVHIHYHSSMIRNYSLAENKKIHKKIDRNHFHSFRS